MISRQEVLDLAALARLSLSEEEVSVLQKDMSEILEYIGQLAEAPLPKETGDARDVRTVMRSDEIRSENDPLAGKEEALRMAFPTREGGFNAVRKIIEKDEA
jgi:aspartyl/glutamyl-tRNA(Asn/Gln) amidotransferase C subunit